MLRPLTERRIIAVGAIAAVIVLFVTVAAINRFRLFHAETDLRVLADQFQEYRIVQEAKEKALRLELDDLERTLYASPDAPPLPVRRPASVEAWMLNATNDLRAKVQALERRLYRVEQ